MKKTDLLSRNGNSLLKLGIWIYGIKYFLDMSSIEQFSSSKISDIMLYFSLILISVFLYLKIINEKYSRKAFAGSIIVSLIVVAIMLSVYSKISFMVYVIFWLMFITCKYADINEVLFTIYKCIVVMVTGLAIASLLGIIPNISTAEGRFNLGLKTRESGWYLFYASAIIFYLTP